jgi:esterase/lipase superfamily enzyme
MDKPKVRKRFPKQRRAIRRAGFDGPVVVFSWGSGSPVTGWWIAAEYARRNAHKLGQFLREYRSANPDTTIRVIGFSLGAMVTIPAGQSLADREWSGTVDSLSLIGAAIDDESLAANGTYADCADVFGEIDNFYKTDDQVLDKLYPAAEFDGALGTEGLDGEPPANYEQHQVDYVAHHDAYWRYENGCIPAVVEEWRDE